MVKKKAAPEAAKLTAVSVSKAAGKKEEKPVALKSAPEAMPAKAHPVQPKPARAVRKATANRQADPKRVSRKTDEAVENKTVFTPDLGQDNLKVYVETSKIVAEGFADFGVELAGYAQEAFDIQIAAAKAFADARTFEELLDLQTRAACERLESAIEESARLTDLSLSLANRAIEPMRTQFDRQVETFMKPLAA